MGTELRNTFQFDSADFGPWPSELDENHEDYINEGMWARQLSSFLKAELEARGWTIKFIAVEDWGHYIELEDPNQQFACVGCRNVGESKDGLESHLVFGDPNLTEIRRWFRKNIDTSEVATKIGNDLDDILSKDERCENIRRDYSRNLPE